MLYLGLSRNYTSSHVQDACSTKGRCAIKGFDGLQISSSASYVQDLQDNLGLVSCLFDGFRVKLLEEIFFFLVLICFF